MKVRTAARTKAQDPQASGLKDDCPRSCPGGVSPYATIWELMSVPCREALIGSAHQVNGCEQRGPRHQETTMPRNLLHDEYTPQELAGGRS